MRTNAYTKEASDAEDYARRADDATIAQLLTGRVVLWDACYSVAEPENTKTYRFKALSTETFEKGELVVVPGAKRGYAIVSIIGQTDMADFDVTALDRYNFKWIVHRLDRTELERRQAVDRAINSRVALAAFEQRMRLAFGDQAKSALDKTDALLQQLSSDGETK